MKTYKIAVSFKIENGKIQLYGEKGEKLKGKGTQYIGSYACDAAAACAAAWRAAAAWGEAKFAKFFKEGK